MQKYKKLGIWVLGLLLILLVLPFFISLETYLLQAESMASKALGVPIKLSKADLFFLPTPHVSISGIDIGESKDAHASKVVITPTLSTLFSSQRIIDVELQDVTLKQSALGMYELLSKDSSSTEPATVILRKLEIKRLNLDFPDSKIPESDVLVTLKDNQLNHATVTSTDGKIHMALTPEGENHHAVLTVNEFELPGNKKFEIDAGTFDMMLKLKGSQLDISRFNLSLYQGNVSGKGMLRWAKNWQLKGDFTVEHLSLAQPSRMISPDTYMSGSLHGQGGFSAQAKNAENLANGLLTDFTFKVDNGVLHGVDLIKAASLLVKQKDFSGETQFDQFSGKLNVSGKQYKLSKLQINSGLLTAAGHVRVSPKDELDGLIDVQIKKSAGLVSVPLAVSGTLNSPTVLPSKAALAGAAVGTAVLGPGVGTSLGIKASEGLNKLKKGLFGGD